MKGEQISKRRFAESITLFRCCRPSLEIPFQFLEVIEVFGDYLWVEYLCHAFIMPSTKWNGKTSCIRLTFYP
jgi:hypothetical protein